MRISKDDFNDIESLADALESSFYEFKEALKSIAPQIYERWHAYGEQVSNEFVSEYSLSDVRDSLAEAKDEEQNNLDWGLFGPDTIF